GSGFPLAPPALTNQMQSDLKQHRVQSLVSFNGYLYAGTYSRAVGGSSFGAQIWRHDAFTTGELGQNPTEWAASLQRWQKVVNNGLTSTNNEAVMHMFVFNNQLYAGLYNAGGSGKLIKTSNGTTWTTLTNNFGAIGNYIATSAQYNGRIYIGLHNGGVYSSPDGVSWVNHTGQMSPLSGRAMAVANGILYVGGGTSIYKSSDGSSFSVSTSSISNVSTMIGGSQNRLFVGVGVDPTDYQNSPRQARIWCLGCTTPPVETGDVIIKLPPKSVYTPETLLFDGSTYSFSATTGEFTGPSRFTINTDVVGTGLFESYEITIQDIERGQAAYLPGREKLTAFNQLINDFSAKAYAPPPATNVLLLGTFPVYEFKMSFQRLASAATVDNLAANLPIGYELADITDGDCSAAGNTHICFKPTLELSNFSGNICLSPGSCTLNLQEVVALTQPGQIVVEGNVLGGFEVGGFVFPNGSNQDWVAVGGNFTAEFNQQNDNQKLSNYVAGNAKLQWGSASDSASVAYKLNKLKNDGIAKATTLDSTPSYTTFNLNSPTANPGAAGESSFTTGPGGKIWYKNGNLTLGSLATQANVRGEGTLIVNGNLTVANDLICQNNTKFGVIATGNITFNSPTIECGAYTSLEGNIIFNSNISSNSEARGIFVTRGDIILPTVSQGGNYLIRYDSTFAQEPSALFSELLKIVFTTSS
ncbi:MAG: hypothetical protein WD157_01350, partial [Patescibacteria group bacterium]